MITIRKDHTKSGKKSKWFAKNYRGRWMFLENGGQRKNTSEEQQQNLTAELRKREPFDRKERQMCLTGRNSG